MAIVRYVTVLEQRPDEKLGGLFVRVLLEDIDTALLGKGFQAPGEESVIHTEGRESVADALQQLYADRMQCLSAKARTTVVEDLLIAAGLRTRDQEGRCKLSPLAEAIDAVPVIGEDEDGRAIVDLEAYGLRR